MVKIAGILDSVQNEIPSGIWVDGKLRPLVRSKILNTLYSVVPEEYISDIVVIGSITGYRYKPTTDVDINVTLNPEYNDLHKELNIKLRSVNEQDAPGTEHPINYYTHHYFPKASWKQAQFGVYDVLEDSWIVEPSMPIDIRSAKDRYLTEYGTAGLFKRNFERLIDEYHKDSQDLKSLSNIKKIKSKNIELKQDISRLIDFEKFVHKNREFAYDRGWGVPRESFRNILYKLIESGEYGNVLNALKSLRRSGSKI